LKPVEVEGVSSIGACKM